MKHSIFDVIETAISGIGIHLYAIAGAVQIYNAVVTSINTSFKNKSYIILKRLYMDTFGIYDIQKEEFDILHKTSIIAFEKYVHTANYKKIINTKSVNKLNMYEHMMTVYMYRIKEFLPEIFLRSKNSTRHKISRRPVQKRLSLERIRNICNQVGLNPRYVIDFQEFAYNMRFNEKDAEKFIRSSWKYEKDPDKLFDDIDIFFKTLMNASTINSNIMKKINTKKLLPDNPNNRGSSEKINNIMKRYHSNVKIINKRKTERGGGSFFVLN